MGSRHARTRGRHRRRRPPGTVRGRGVLVTAGVALLIAAGAATAPAEHPTVGAGRPVPHPIARRPATPGADGGVVPAAPMPSLPLPRLAIGPAGPPPAPIGAVAPIGTGGVAAVSYVGGIPSTVLAAYRATANDLAQSQPGCHLPVELLAAIGKVESGHARGGQVDVAGTAVHRILGPVLNGTNGFAAIPDTDHGVLDGDPVWDRAVGPMQFIPSTWQRWASDGNHDGVADPENVYDATLAAARYLCADGHDLSTDAGIQAAVLSYNDSAAYLRLVTAWLTAYRGGIAQLADVITPASPATGTPAVPAPAPPPATPAPVSPPMTTVAAPTPNPPPVGTGPVPPAPPVGPVTTAPTTTAVPTTSSPPVQSLLCGLQDTLGGLGSLLGLAPPPPPCPATDPAQPAH